MGRKTVLVDSIFGPPTLNIGASNNWIGRHMYNVFDVFSIYLRDKLNFLLVVLGYSTLFVMYHQAYCNLLTRILRTPF